MDCAVLHSDVFREIFAHLKQTWANFKRLFQLKEFPARGRLCAHKFTETGLLPLYERQQREEVYTCRPDCLHTATVILLAIHHPPTVFLQSAMLVFEIRIVEDILFLIVLYVFAFYLSLILSPSLSRTFRR